MNQKRLRLLKVTPEGYLVGTGHARKSTQILVPHEALVAIVGGLTSSKNIADAFVERAGEVDCLALRDLANGFRRQAQGVAWRLGVCSWDCENKAIPYDRQIFVHASK